MNDDYLSDEELLDFIDEIENNAMLKAPMYLKGQILQQIEGEKKKNIRQQLLVYKIKIIGAMAAAIILLFLLPVSVQGEPNTANAENQEQHNDIFDCWNAASSQLLQQMDTISEQLLHPLDTLKEHFSRENN
ncbi:MAG: hypothetical protein NC124_01940 [Clostridium sp.]|nr:hypothetical protein [Clostridium sp.]MCM1534692.1 hypothetical protein [Clostridium sp.]